jgi:hypothetical protein
VHLPGRQRALERMVAAVRPGGWVVAEDPDHGGAMIPALRQYVHPPDHAELWERIFHGLDALFTHGGADASFDRGCLGRSPRQDWSGSAPSCTRHCCTGRRELLELTIQQLQGPLASTGLVTEPEIECFLDLLRQPSFGHLPFVMVTAWGQRGLGPAATAPCRSSGHARSRPCAAGRPARI